MKLLTARISTILSLLFYSTHSFAADFLQHPTTGAYHTGDLTDSRTLDAQQTGVGASWNTLRVPAKEQDAPSKVLNRGLFNASYGLTKGLEASLSGSLVSSQAQHLGASVKYNLLSLGLMHLSVAPFYEHALANRSKALSTYYQPTKDKFGYLFLTTIGASLPGQIIINGGQRLNQSDRYENVRLTNEWLYEIGGMWQWTPVIGTFIAAKGRSMTIVQDPTEERAAITKLFGAREYTAGIKINTKAASLDFYYGEQDLKVGTEQNIRMPVAGAGVTFVVDMSKSKSPSGEKPKSATPSKSVVEGNKLDIDPESDKALPQDGSDDLSQVEKRLSETKKPDPINSTETTTNKDASKSAVSEPDSDFVPITDTTTYYDKDFEDEDASQLEGITADELNWNGLED